MQGLFKPLEWDGQEATVTLGDIPALSYSISLWKDDFLAEVDRPDWEDYQVIEKCTSLEDAKSACEAHYTKAILSCLSPSMEQYLESLSNEDLLQLAKEIKQNLN